MAHVTFIHGIANKPEAEQLVREWRRALAAGDDGLDLGTKGITSRMVYWADVLYERPAGEQAARESLEGAIERTGAWDVEMGWRAGTGEEERRWVEALAGTLGLDTAPDDEASPPEETIGVELERVPLPWWLKRRLMEALLRDVHHYLFNSRHSPRPGVTYLVRDEIRRRLVEALGEGARRPPPHVLVSHSMGTVIAYDCLKRAEECPGVDGLMTIGSPLGLDEIQDKLRPGWSREDGFPRERLSGAWINVFDALDPVAGFDPRLSDDYRRRGVAAVEDLNEQNWGRWRHDITKYLGGAELRRRLEALLGLG